ncbi:hypothetical protein FB451DRAFT_90766 [Mycena latifolia]|nr:hypothetical protein FB451DRAFT_90766 [Mycena latifolia]
MVLSACGLIYSTQEVTILREGKEMGRQAVFNVAGTWIVRIFELHDGYRQPATFLWQVLKSLEGAGAASERIQYHGTLPATDFHYTVTKFVSGIPLTDELCSHPSIRQQVASLFRAMWNLSVPSTVFTVEDYMRPRLERLHGHLSFISPAVSQQVGTLASLPDFQGFRMVVSHCDMVPENIIGRLEPSVDVSVIDWEFCNYVPEFRVAAQLGRKAGRQVWGDNFIQDIGYGPYSDQVVWTESLCMIAEDYVQEDFEAQVLIALTSR